MNKQSISNREDSAEPGWAFKFVYSMIKQALGFNQ